MTRKPLGFGRRNDQSAEDSLPAALENAPRSKPRLGAGNRSLVAQTAVPSAPVHWANAPALTPTGGATVDAVYEHLEPLLDTLFDPDTTRAATRLELATRLEKHAKATAIKLGLTLDAADLRDVITVLLNEVIDRVGGLEDNALATPVPRKAGTARADMLEQVKSTIQPLLMTHVDATIIAELSRAEVAEQVHDIISDLLRQEKINLNSIEQRDLITLLLNDMLGLGPLEPLLADDTITDIMVNGPNHIYAEIKGKLQLTDLTFRDEQHLLNIAQRIVNAVGRRVDETSPICDARLLDGSRVNVIVPPLAIDGTSISIRKFAKRKITLETMAEQDNLSFKMCQLLKIAGRCRLNIIISGGTGSGKTTMLNAISRTIDPGERIVTIEDAAELQLQQPHVVRLETRPANLEGEGEVSMRALVKNALRMRPDRIILGEVRGPEAIDLLQAMNTGHDGSLGTLHANRPREALTRLENMIGMAGLNLPPKAIRTQICDAVHLIIQISRMRDGKRRVTYITEVVGMEGDVVTTQDLYLYQYQGENAAGELIGDFVSCQVRPAFYERAEYFGLGRTLMDCL